MLLSRVCVLALFFVVEFAGSQALAQGSAPGNGTNLGIEMSTLRLNQGILRGALKPISIDGLQSPRTKLLEQLKLRDFGFEEFSVLSEALRTNFGLAPERIVPTGDKGPSQGPLLNQIAIRRGWSPSDIKTAREGVGSSQNSACNADLVERLERDQRQVNDISQNEAGNNIRQPAADDRLYLRLTNPILSAKLERPEAVAALQALEATWRSVLAACFQRPDSGEHWAALKARVGAFQASIGAPVCSGLLIQDGSVLTARHCFFDFQTGAFVYPNTQQITFMTADGGKRLSVDMAKLRSMDGSSFSYEREPFVVPVQQSGTPLSTISVEDKVVAFSDGPTAWKDRTLLVVYATVPLSGVLDPAAYPASVARPIAGGCYVLAQQATCIAHMCNVVPGSSGASLFSSGSVSPRLIGVHVGPEQVNQSCTSIPSSTANIAARAVNPG